MGCPSIAILGKNLTFSIQAATTPTGDVNYGIYEDTTTTEILTGTMTKDFDSKTGFCLTQIACTTANGFERYKSYTVRITGTVAGVSLARDYTFICLGGEDAPQVTTGALTTLSNFKTYANIDDSDDDALITALISRATSAIENYCDRILRSSSYRERYNGDDTSILILHQYPVTEISLLATEVEDAIRLTNTSTDAWNARVSVSDTTMSLTIDGGTNDGSDDLTLSSYTLNTLVTAINALGKGWSAQLLISNFGIYDADELLTCSNLQCPDKQYAYVKIPTNLEEDFLIQGGIVSPYRMNNGTVFLPTTFPSGTQNILVRYTAGYATTPADLEQICIDLVNMYYRGRETDSTIKSEKLGDHSITYANEGAGARDIPNHLAKRLAPYKRFRMAI